MNAFIVRSSELAAARRWDAPFHRLAQTHRASTDALKNALSDKEALDLASEIFEALPQHFRQVIAPLVRTQQTGAPGKERLQAALQEYPHLSIAMFQSLEEEIATHFEQQRKDIEARQARVRKNTDRALQAIKRKAT